MSAVTRSISTPHMLLDRQTCSIHRPCEGAQNIALGGQRCSLYVLVSSHCLYLLQHHCHRSTAVVCHLLQSAKTGLAYMPQECACTEAPTCHKHVLAQQPPAILHRTALHCNDSCYVILTHKAGGPCRLEPSCCWTAASRCPADPSMSNS